MDDWLTESFSSTKAAERFVVEPYMMMIANQSHDIKEM